MSTPTEGPGGQPNPYGAPSGQPANPYGATPPTQPAGGGGYGGAYPGGPQYQEPQGGKGLAIAALVLAFIPCLQIISLILAIIVLVKKKAGKGLAIAALIIDILAIIGLIIAVVAGGLWISENVITVDNAKVGQCVSTDTGDGDEVGLLKQDCEKKHDAEVFVVGDLTADEITLYDTDPGQICVDRYTEEGEDVNTLPGDFINILTQDLSPEEGDPFVCISENEDESQLPAK